MKCFNCGKTIDEGAIICPHCKKEQGISRELFEAAKAKDQKACEELYNLCYGNVYYTAKSMVKDEDAIWDIVKDTFIQAFKSLDWMEYMEGNFQAWIRRIAHNTTVNYVKKKKPMLVSEMETDDKESGMDFLDERREDLTEVVMDREKAAGLIQEILNTLSEEQRLAAESFAAAAAAEQSAAVSAETAAEQSAEVSTETAAETAGRAGLFATKGPGLKIAGCALVLVLACGGIAYSASGKNTEEKAVVTLTTESDLPAETESETERESEIKTEIVSESEKVIVEDPIELHAMIADEPDWEADEQIVLGNANLLRSEVTSVAFLNSSDELTGYAEDMVWDVSEEGDGSVMAYAIENAEADYALYIVSDYGVYANADCSYMFAYYSSAVTISFNGLFNTEYVTDMSGMFSDDDALENLDLTGFDTANVTDMNSMFYGCSSLQEVDVSLWNTAFVTDMSYMFQECASLSALDLTGFNTMGVENMTFMFEGCNALTTLDLSSFQTADVTDMSYMFQSCHQLTALDVSGFDTGNVTDMSYMFQSCEMLESLDLSSFDTSEVVSMSGMFEDCSLLITLDVSSFDTANVQYMDNMFRACASLTALDVSNFQTQNVGNMNGMFSGCESLTTLDVSNFDTSNVGDMSEMFYYCTSLSIDLSSFDFSNVSSVADMTEGCKSVAGLEE